MSALKFIISSYQQKSSTKQRLHNNESLGTYHVAKQPFQIQWANKAKQFREHCQHFVSHSFKALRTLLTKHPAKRNYKEPTRLETNSKNIKQRPYLQNKDIQRPSILKRNFSTKLRLETYCTQNLGTNS